MNFNAFWRLMRFDKPVGILLLWYPTAWALWVANDGFPPLNLLILFLIGTVLMRAAGCVVNDIADRNFDKHVARTKLRPLTSGELSLQAALGLLVLLLSAALIVLIQLPWACFYWAIAAVVITLLYPFCKRYINAPQLVLGLAFSMGMPMAFAALGKPLNAQFIFLFLINFLWIVAYDTMYAMADKADDLKIGVKSTAIYFASYDLLILKLLCAVMHALWLLWAIYIDASYWFYGAWVIAGMVLLYQQKLLQQRIPEQCFRAFLVSVYYGGLMWVAVVNANLATGLLLFPTSLGLSEGTRDLTLQLDPADKPRDVESKRAR